MNRDPWDPSIEESLGALAVFDVSPQSAMRTRRACLAALAARAAVASEPGQAARASWAAWVEPAAAIVVCAVYLASALRASMVLVGRW
jgi:hypothetical protein